MKRSLIAVLSMLAVTATPLSAGNGPPPPPSEQIVARKGSPTVGLGLSFAFGPNGLEPGVGIRVMSDNRRNRAAASIGLDYMFMSQSVRGTLGAVYLGRNIFGGADVGYNFSSSQIDFGLVAGGTQTKSRFRTIPNTPVETCSIC
ncbi:MAG: hypothetical protein LAT78_08555 [Roseinatronobacter sp.]|nr:hypothetical protein [Roseinatronobacter sp.]